MMPLVLPAFELAGLGIDRDALAVAPMVTLLERVALGGQFFRGIGGKVGFDVKDVRQVLMVKARRIHGLLDVEATFSNAEEDVEHGGGDGRAAG